MAAWYSHTLYVPYGQDDLIQEFRETYPEAMRHLDERGQSAGDCSWTECEEQLREFSKKHPLVLLELYVSGEGEDDLWKYYFLNGKMQEVMGEITYPSFDKSKLK